MLSASQAAFLVGYKGLSVAQIQTLRNDLREVGGNLKVTKARLMKIAAQNIQGIESFRDNFKDQVGLVFAQEEVPGDEPPQEEVPGQKFHTGLAEQVLRSSLRRPRHVSTVRRPGRGRGRCARSHRRGGSATNATAHPLRRSSP